MFPRLMNVPEQIVHGRLRDVCDRYGASVHTKVRVADVFQIQAGDVDQVLYEYALMAHFDFVVCDEDKRPLFAVEFDGPSHRDPTQLKRDRKKDEICRSYAFPLKRYRKEDLRRTVDKLDILTEQAEQWFEARTTEMDSQLRCPVCGAEMQKRIGPYGEFFGCVRYSDANCKGKREIPPPHPRTIYNSETPSDENENVLSSPVAGSAPVSNSSLPGVILAILATIISGLLFIFVIFTITNRPEPPANRSIAAAPAPVQIQPVIVHIPPPLQASPAVSQAHAQPENSETDAASNAQRGFMLGIIKRLGWDSRQRDVQIEEILGYKQNFSSLTKDEAHQILNVWVPIYEEKKAQPKDP